MADNSLFDLDGELFNSGKNKTNNKDKVKKSSDDLTIYQKTLEHLFGFYECINFISKQKRYGANIKIDKNIIYLDSIASKDFFMSDGKQIKTIKYEMEKGKKVMKTYPVNPFITCIYDFFHLIDWACAYIYKNHLYLIANNKSVNSPHYSHLKYFGLAIYCDNIDKFKIFNETEFLDLRSMKYLVDDIYEDPDDEYSEVSEEVTLYVEENHIEKQLRCMVLNSNNSHLIHSFSEKEFEQEHNKFSKIIKTNPDKAMGRFNLQYSGMREFYDADTLMVNQNRRSYINEELDAGMLKIGVNVTDYEKLDDINSELK